MKITAHKDLDSVVVNEEFTSFDTRPLDSKHRITLGGKVLKAVTRGIKKIDSYQILVGKNGDILLRPAVSIPASEVWLYKNPKALAEVLQGIKDAGERKLKPYQPSK